MEKTEACADLSLYGVCKTCVNNCCYSSVVNVLPEERDLIVSRTGRADDFKLSAEGIIQINNSSVGPCVFLNTQDHTCTINDIKPFECKIYPLMSTEDDDKFVMGSNCPAEARLSENYIKTAKLLTASVPSYIRAKFYAMQKKAGYAS